MFENQWSNKTKQRNNKKKKMLAATRTVPTPNGIETITMLYFSDSLLYGSLVNVTLAQNSTSQTLQGYGLIKSTRCSKVPNHEILELQHQAYMKKVIFPSHPEAKDSRHTGVSHTALCHCYLHWLCKAMWRKINKTFYSLISCLLKLVSQWQVGKSSLTSIAVVTISFDWWCE